VGALGQVRAIQPHPKRRKHVILVIEGSEDLTVHEDVVVALGLSAGTPLSAETLRSIATQAQVVRATQAASAQLAHRPRSRQELVRSLRQKGFDDGVAEQALAKLEKLGFINDARFARDLAQSLCRRNTGRRAIVYKLQKSGVSDELIQEAVAEVLEDVDDTERALEALQKRLGKWRGLPAMKRRAKSYQLLARLGFDADTIADVLRIALVDETHAQG